MGLICFFENKLLGVFRTSGLLYWNIYGNDGVAGRLEYILPEEGAGGGGEAAGSTQKLFYLKDHLGSTRAVINTNGAVTESYDYYPFGLKMPGRVYPTTPTVTKNLFTGKERDVETGWDYFEARYYSAAIGRWLSVDLAGYLAPGWSPYAYTFNDPINFFDPDGEFPFTLHTRSFAPFNWFGGGFKGDGDNRRFSTSGNVTSRIRSEIDIETETMEITRKYPEGSTSIGGYGLWSAQSEAYITTSENATPLISHLYGNNDAATELSPNIDIHSNISINVTEGGNGNQILTLSGNITGDKFPAAEVFATDIQGNSVFLGVSPAGGGAVSGPIQMLPGNNQRPMSTVNVSILVNQKGVFIGVIQGDKIISISEWNKQFEDVNPKKED